MLVRIAFVILIIILQNSLANCQNSRIRKVNLSTKAIKVIEGDSWESDVPVRDDIFNNYQLIVAKDSTKIELYGVTKNYKTPGTRNMLILDSANRPIGFDGDIDFSRIKYSYKWYWSKAGRILYIDEYIFGVKNRRVYFASKLKTK